MQVSKDRQFRGTSKKIFISRDFMFYIVSSQYGMNHCSLLYGYLNIEHLAGPNSIAAMQRMLEPSVAASTLLQLQGTGRNAL